MLVSTLMMRLRIRDGKAGVGTPLPLFCKILKTGGLLAKYSFDEGFKPLE
jgi:hypothetical protein